MEKTEALEKLKAVKPTDDPWYRNQAISWQTAHATVVRCTQNLEGEYIPEWVEKRIKQVLKNKKVKTCNNCGAVI